MLTLDRCTPDKTPVEYFKTADTTLVDFTQLEMVACKDRKENIYHPYKDRTRPCCPDAKQNGTHEPKTYKLENIRKQLCPKLDPGERTIIFGHIKRSPQAIADKHHQLNLTMKLVSNYDDSQFENLTMVYGSLVKHHEKNSGLVSTLIVWETEAEKTIVLTQKTLQENRREERLQRMFLKEALETSTLKHILNTHNPQSKTKLENFLEETTKEILNDQRLWLTPSPRPLSGASWQVLKLFYQIKNHNFMHVPQSIKTYLEHKQLELVLESEKDTQNGKPELVFEKNPWVQTPTLNPAVVEILESLYEPQNRKTTKPYAGEFLQAHQIALTLI